MASLVTVDNGDRRGVIDPVSYTAHHAGPVVDNNRWIEKQIIYSRVQSGWKDLDIFIS
jgi:hypothetical protein